VTPCSDVVEYYHFGRPHCLHLQGEVSGSWIEIEGEVFWVMTPYSDVAGPPFQRTMLTPFSECCSLDSCYCFHENQGLVTGVHDHSVYPEGF